MRRINTFSIPLGGRDRGHLHAALQLLGLERAYSRRPPLYSRGDRPELECYLVVPRQAGFGAAGEWLVDDLLIEETGGGFVLRIACYGEQDRPNRLPAAVVDFIHRLLRAYDTAEVNVALERLLSEDDGPEEE